MSLRSLTVFILLLAASVLTGCNKADGPAASSAANTTAANTKANTTAVKPNEDGTIPSGTGVEKEKPEAGKANVQGKAFYNDKPAAGVEVKLCSKFSQYVGGCSGEIFTAKTDDAGEYLIKNVPPGTYEGLTVKVFDTPYYVFATSGFVSAAKYNIETDKTYFAPDSNLFKNDVKVVSPKAGSTVAPDGIAVKWDAYPDAAYYKLSINADTASGAETVYDFISKRVDDPGFTLDKPLKPGSYTVRIDVFNANDRKLAQSSNDIKFAVK